MWFCYTPKQHTSQNTLHFPTFSRVYRRCVLELHKGLASVAQAPYKSHSLTPCSRQYCQVLKWGSVGKLLPSAPPFCPLRPLCSHVCLGFSAENFTNKTRGFILLIQRQTSEATTMDNMAFFLQRSFPKNTSHQRSANKGECILVGWTARS